MITPGWYKITFGYSYITDQMKQIAGNISATYRLKAAQHPSLTS